MRAQWATMPVTVCALLTLVLLSSLTIGCVSPRHTAQYVVQSDEFVGPPLVGIGVQLPPFVYCAPNWPGIVNESNVHLFEQGLIELAPQHVRIFAEKEWWMPELPQALHPERKESFFKVLELARRAGATVNMTLWHGPYPDIDRAAKAFCDGVVEAVVTRGFTNVQYVTLQNEVNYSKMKPAEYVALYKAFDKHLRAAGLRDRIQIIGGDLVGEHQVMWFGALGEGLHDVLDGYAVHIYNPYTDGDHLKKRVREIPVIVNAIQKEARKPIQLTEFGVYSLRRERGGMSGYTPEGTPIYETAIPGIGNAWYILECLNHGYNAMVAWEACDMNYGDGVTHWAHDNSKFGMMSSAQDNFRKRPVYWMMKLFTNTSKPGYRAVRVKGDQDENISVAATRGPTGEWVVYAMNRGDAVTISIAGLPTSTDVGLLTWNADGKGLLESAGASRTDRRGTVELTVERESVVALTTVTSE